LPYSYWQEYLEWFDAVRPVARMRWAAQPEPNWSRADGPNVVFTPLSDYQGFWQMLRHVGRKWLRMRRALAHGDYFLLRGGHISALAWAWLTMARVPYAREVVGHEGEAVAMMANVQMLGLGRWLARLSEWLGRRESLGACAVNYVARFLNGHYPARPEVPVYFFSDVQLDNGAMTGPRLAESFSSSELRMVSIGRMNPEKGYAVLLDALHELDSGGLRAWTLDVMGPGPELERLRQRAADYKQADRVRFHGMVRRGPEFFALLDRSDLFVLPSLGGEGMPRAALEAMARGLPAVSTRLGGMSDLLDDDCLVAPGDRSGLARLIRDRVGQPRRLAEESRRRFETVRHYRPDEMRRQKHEFWQHLCDCTDRWRRRTGRDYAAKGRSAAVAQT